MVLRSMVAPRSPRNDVGHVSAHRVPVLVAEVPELIGDIVCGLLERIPFADVHRGRAGALSTDVDRFRIRVLIVGLAGAPKAHAVMLSRPGLKVLVIAPGSGDGEVHEFVPTRRGLGQICEETLAHALRDAAVAWPPVWERL
jgi:hypothetical protein